MSTNLEFREKHKVGDRPVKLNEEKRDRELERKIWSYFVERTTLIFFSGGEKMKKSCVVMTKLHNGSIINAARAKKVTCDAILLY